MLMMRARAFALRDAFPDVLSGLYLREEFERGQGDRDNDRERERKRERHQDTDTEWDKQTDPYKGGDLNRDLRSQPSTAQQQDEVEHSDQKPDRASVSKTNLSKYKRRAPPPPSMQDSATSQSIEPAAAAPDLSPTGSLLAAEGVALQADITSSDMLLSSETDPDQSSTEIDFHGGTKMGEGVADNAQIEVIISGSISASLTLNGLFGKKLPSSQCTLRKIEQKKKL
jgi:hypothetical protein